jgi:glycine/D-amino acid oxidase-like deaminating enzyme
MLAAQHGQRVELWSRRKIFEEFDIRTDFVGRFIPGDGTYHPFKYVCGLISAALKSGVELYTRVRVKRIRSMIHSSIEVRCNDRWSSFVGHGNVRRGGYDANAVSGGLTYRF